ncbi:MAG: hypothetical protein SPF22_07725 [Candidatus Onthovivens sp.]|nr:hypothetical protein [Candidatus Onthovivens sp.]
MTVYYDIALNGYPPGETVAGKVLPLTQINQILGLFKPTLYDRSQLASSNKTTITIYAGLQVAINGKIYFTQEDKTITVADFVDAASRKGKDCYIYACQPSDANSFSPNIVISLNSTVPTGYTAANSRKIGGFHCMCADVGTKIGSSHPYYGYVAGDIIPISMWDLRHLPEAEPEGMVYIRNIGKWVDIYLVSWTGSKLQSAYGATIADGATTHTTGSGIHGEKFVEYLGEVKKRLMTRDEFIVIAQGTPELVNINGSSDPGTTGGHVMTNGYRCISNFALEDCTGVLWQWVQDQYEYWPGTTIPSDIENNKWLSGYSWNYASASVYNKNCDSAMHGSAYGILRRSLVGGDWGLGAYCCPQCVTCNNFSSHLDSVFSARGVAEPRRMLSV